MKDSIGTLIRIHIFGGAKSSFPSCTCGYRLILEINFKFV